MEQSSVFDRNPWETDDTAHGAVCQVLAIARSTGHIQSNINDGSISQDFNSKITDKVQSLKVLHLMKDIDKNRQTLQKIILEIQQRLSDKETKDLTHRDILEKKVQEVSQLNDHIQKVISEKDQLIVKLQQPYVGDFIKLEASYKRYVSEVFPQLVPVLSDLSSNLENIEWANKVDLSDGQLESILNDVSSSLAAMQSEFQGISHMRQSMKHLYSCTTGNDNDDDYS